MAPTTFQSLIANRTRALSKCMHHGLSFAEAMALLKKTYDDTKPRSAIDSAYDIRCAMRNGLSFTDGLTAVTRGVNPLHICNAMRSGLGLSDAIGQVRGGSFCYDPRSFGESLAMAA